MPEIALVHGIHTDGGGNIDLMADRLVQRGFKPKDIVLPIRNAISARWSVKRDASILFQATRQYDDVFAHSNGCRVALKCAERRRFRQIWLFGPALASDYDLRRIAGQPTIHCVHSPDDWAVRLGSRLLFHPFGDAGVSGMKDVAVANHESRGNHTDAYFGKDVIDKWMDIYEREDDRIRSDPSIPQRLHDTPGRCGFCGASDSGGDG